MRSRDTFVHFPREAAKDQQPLGAKGQRGRKEMQEAALHASLQTLPALLLSVTCRHRPRAGEIAF